MQDIKLQRRQVFQALIALSAVGGLAACGGAEETSPDPVSEASTTGFFSASEMALIAALSDTIIPQTETGGAVAAGVPETLQALATEWGDDGFRSYWRQGLVKLSAALKGASGADFDAMEVGERLAMLASYDASVFDGETEDGFYRDIKSTIVQAYYMSEIGAAEELAYEPVPGEWIGCVPLSDFPKTWAT